jgi:hypothetical protein
VCTWHYHRYGLAGLHAPSSEKSSSSCWSRRIVWSSCGLCRVVSKPRSSAAWTANPLRHLRSRLASRPSKKTFLGTYSTCTSWVVPGDAEADVFTLGPPPPRPTHRQQKRHKGQQKQLTQSQRIACIGPWRSAYAPRQRHQERGREGKVRVNQEFTAVGMDRVRRRCLCCLA